MLKALTKKRSANFYSNQVKLLSIIILSVLFLNAPAVRNFTADTMRMVASVVDTY